MNLHCPSGNSGHVNSTRSGRVRRWRLFYSCTFMMTNSVSSPEEKISVGRVCHADDFTYLAEFFRNVSMAIFEKSSRPAEAICWILGKQSRESEPRRFSRQKTAFLHPSIRNLIPASPSTTAVDEDSDGWIGEDLDNSMASHRSSVISEQT